MLTDGVPSHYTSYLLRVWRVEGQRPPGLRALLWKQNSRRAEKS